MNDDQDAGVNGVADYPMGISSEVVHHTMTSMRTLPRTDRTNNSNTSKNKVKVNSG